MPGDAVVIRLHVGENFKSDEEKPFQKKQTVRLQLFANGAETDLAAKREDEAKPLATITAKKAGTALVALERSPRTIELTAEKFNAYLKEEGLDAILEARKKSGDDGKPGKERPTARIGA